MFKKTCSLDEKILVIVNFAYSSLIYFIIFTFTAQTLQNSWDTPLGKGFCQFQLNEVSMLLHRHSYGGTNS